MANANVIPPDAEKLIFAVDVVRFFLNKHHPDVSFELIKTDIENNVNCYRSNVRELFNDNFEKVLKDIDDTQSVIVHRDFSEIQNKDGINGSSLEKYSTLFKNSNLNKDFQAGNFLTYCSRIASMACMFYTNGCNDALDMAVDLIKSSFPDDEKKYNLIFEKMESAALKYASDVVGEGAAFLFRRDSDPEFSGTEDSSSSSVFTSETESATESQYMTSASSEESLTALILRLNASVAGKGCSDKSKSKGSALSSVVCAQSCQSSIQNPTASSSSSSKISETVKGDTDMSCEMESSFKVANPTSTALLAESPRKSCLGKRPSPRKGNPSSVLATVYDDSETEVKKPKLDLPETDKMNDE